MQGGWPDFRALVFNVTANSGTSHSSSSWKVPKGGADGSNFCNQSSNSISASSSGPSSFSDVTPLSSSSSYSPNSISPIPGKLALGNGMAAVLHAAGAFLRLLRHTDGERRSRRRHKNKEKIKTGNDLKIVSCVPGGITPETRMFAICTNGGLTSFFFSRISSVLKGGWSKLKCHDALLPTMMAALLPPSSLALSQQGQEAFGVDICDGAVFGLPSCNSPTTVVEPKTGLEFPTQLSCNNVDEQAGDASPSCQILAGVGARSKEIMKFKSIKIYAFGLYVRPDHLRGQLGDKYKGFTAEELKDRPDFLDDLLRRHEVEMTLRLVVHYKGLKIGMVRNAFQDSLKNRLNKIEGGENDEGLQTFCSYLSDDIRLHQGSTIDIRWQRGGRLRTEIEGRRVGVIHSPPLCQAFFDLYIGDPPVSAIAKQEIGANFARILGERSS
ncbi:hypothetical protein M758_8G059300 [Ceratodon purpureus]|nr:hypothetical protein M758_8G059300 [Ceratodon purpureus]